MIERLTLEDLNKMEPCDKYSENDFAYARELFDDRYSLKYDEIIELQISCKDKIWILLRMMSEEEHFILLTRVLDCVVPILKQYIVYVENTDFVISYLADLANFALSVIFGKDLDIIYKFAKELESKFSNFYNTDFHMIVNYHGNLLQTLMSIIQSIVQYFINEKEKGSVNLAFYKLENIGEYFITVQEITIDAYWYLEFIEVIFEERESDE